MANFALNTTVTGLQEFDIAVPNAGTYQVRGKLQLPANVVPTAAQGAGGGTGNATAVASAIPSQVVSVVKLNSTTVLTSAAGDRGFKTSVNATAAGDLIKIILSSSLAQDNQPEAVQCTISIYEGVS